MTKPISWPAADKEWTLFLDRDGVINERPPGDYVRDIEGFRWLPGVLTALPLLSSVFGRIIVVTNQQGVGLGLMTTDQLEIIHKYLTDTVAASGGRIDMILSCTKRRDESENCRKPEIFMAYRAKQMFPEIDFEKSVMVGDTESDILFGKNAGMVTVMIGNEPSDPMPDYRLSSLAEFALMFKFSDE